MITGVLGPQSNAHGPNEFLHIPPGKRLTACVAEVRSTSPATRRADRPPGDGQAVDRLSPRNETR
jgi:hypothetical protein